MYTNAVWCPPSFPFVVWCGVDIDVSEYIYIYKHIHLCIYLGLPLWSWVHPPAVVLWCVVPTPLPPIPLDELSCHPPSLWCGMVRGSLGFFGCGVVSSSPVIPPLVIWCGVDT